MCMIGPKFAKIFNSGLYGLPIFNLEKIAPFKITLKRIMFYSMILACIQIGLDVYVLIHYHVIYFLIFFLIM
jgi:hypothetical protein